MIEKLNSTSKSVEIKEGQEGAISLNRIILYIDDLDRCPPERVVEVLQAVHLLLAFPLFIVVVGIDSRWITYSLRDKYRGLLGADDLKEGTSGTASDKQATPYDYLEKIFQIPLWLEQINDEGSRLMLRGLVNLPSSPVPNSLTRHINNTPNGNKDSTPQSFSSGQIPEAPSPSISQHHLMNLNVDAEELQAMEQLAPILKRTPRAVKRFVNVYRLIKVRAESIAEMESFRKDEAHCVLLLLALDIGMPEVGKILCNLIESNLNPHITTLEEFLDQQDLPKELLTIKTWLAVLESVPAWRVLSVETLRKQVKMVRRYSFQ